MADKPFKSDNPPNFLRSSGKDAADTTGGKATPFAKGSPGGTLPPGTSYTKPSSSDPANNAKAPPVPTLRKMNPTLPYTTPAASSLGGGRGGFHPIAAIQHLFGRGNKPKAAAASASANPALPPASKTVDTSSQPPGPGEGYTPKRAAVEAGAPPPSRQAGDLFNQIRARQANTPLTTPRQPVRQSLMTTPVTNQPGKTERVSYTPNTPKLRG
jgi:hypothetical protein